jgi:ribosomal protein S18 acetylase RimI-like enzyme
MFEGMIKLLTPDDAPIFKQIRIEALRAEPAAYASRAEDWETLSLDEWRSRLVEMPVFVAFQNDEPVGIMGLMWQKPSKTTHRATIVMVYVRTSLRGTGLAGKLLETVTNYARDHEIGQLELAVSAENPAACGFYRREGFVEMGRIPGGFLHEGVRIDEIMMYRLISAPVG